MPESVSVQGLGAPTQEVPKGAGGVAPLHDTGLVHWSPPSRKVVRRCLMQQKGKDLFLDVADGGNDDDLSDNYDDVG